MYVRKCKKCQVNTIWRDDLCAGCFTGLGDMHVPEQPEIAVQPDKPACRWCKGTKKIQGFHMETYNCQECL